MSWEVFQSSNAAIGTAFGVTGSSMLLYCYNGREREAGEREREEGERETEVGETEGYMIQWQDVKTTGIVIGCSE